MIRKKELLAHVTAESGLPKRDARSAVDHALAYIRECLLAGSEVDCPPLGKIRVHVQGPNSGTPKTRFRVVLLRDAPDGEDDTDFGTETEAEAEPASATQPEVHRITLEAAGNQGYQPVPVQGD